MKSVPIKITNITSYRVIYGDTDQMGVVYYANYLRWFERGRSEFLRQIGLPYSAIEQQGFNFPVVEVACRYAQSARYDDDIRIETELTEVGRAALSFSYRILRESELHSGNWHDTACIDRSFGPSRAHPEDSARRHQGAGGLIVRIARFPFH